MLIRAVTGRPKPGSFPHAKEQTLPGWKIQASRCRQRRLILGVWVLPPLSSRRKLDKTFLSLSQLDNGVTEHACFTGWGNSFLLRVLGMYLHFWRCVTYWLIGVASDVLRHHKFVATCEAELHLLIMDSRQGNFTRMWSENIARQRSSRAHGRRCWCTKLSFHGKARWLVSSLLRTHSNWCHAIVG
jgi:hypothetical protein